MRRVAAFGGVFASAVLAFATPAKAQIYGSAYGGNGVNYFFQVQPDANGAEVTGLNHVYVGAAGINDDGLPFTAMTAVDGQLKATSIANAGAFNYYSYVTPFATGGAYTSNSGSVSLSAGGSNLVTPVNAMAVHDGQLMGASWNGQFSYLFPMVENANGFGAYASGLGIIEVGQGSTIPLAVEIDSMAEFNGHLYATAFDGLNTVFFEINRNANGVGGWIDATKAGVLTVGLAGQAETSRIDAMVGTADGLFATSWNDINGYNYFFRIEPGAAGAFETDIGSLHFDGGKLPYRIDTLAFLPGAGVGPGAVPEPTTWALMIMGFGAIGATMRRKRPLPAMEA